MLKRLAQAPSEKPVLPFHPFVGRIGAGRDAAAYAAAQAPVLSTTVRMGTLNVA
jgi:hypothetical protein